METEIVREPNLHDAAVHAWRFEPAPDHPGSIALDVDLIVEWIAPVGGDGIFTFRVAPTTVLFEPAWDAKLTLDTEGFTLGQDIELLHCDRVAPNYSAWHLIGNTFVLDFKATRLRYFLRQDAIPSASQRLSLVERGGISFEFHDRAE